jgi:integral membrane protein (TIGR01906 family)
LALAVHGVASRTALELEYSRPGLPAVPGMDGDLRLDLAEVAAQFVVGRANETQLRELELDGRSLFAADEIRHLVDVRELIAILTALGTAAAAVLVMSAAWWWHKRPTWFPVGLQVGGGATVLMVVAAAVTLGVAWRAFFLGFHQVFFEAGTWQFSASSGLITLFPEQFWFDTSVAIAAVCLLCGGLTFAVGRRLGSARTSTSLGDGQ